MTQNTVPLSEPLCRDDTEHGVNYYTANQMHAHAAKVCAEKDAEIEGLLNSLVVANTKLTEQRQEIERLRNSLRIAKLGTFEEWSKKNWQGVLSPNGHDAYLEALKETK